MISFGNRKSTTTDRLSQHARGSVDQVTRAYGKAERRIRNEATGARARVSDAEQRTREQSGNTLRFIRGFIQSNPRMALGAAFAAGTVLSALKRSS